MGNFNELIAAKIILNLNNNFETTADQWYVKSKYKPKTQQKIDNFKDRVINKRIGTYYSSKNDFSQVLKMLINNREELNHYQFLFEHLSDDCSKETLLEVVTMRLMGMKKVKLSVENQEYLQFHEITNNSIIKSDCIKIKNFSDWSLNLYDLKSLGYNVKINYITMGIVTTFGIEQYRYKPLNISPKNGDVILDCGGCWGDTALYFANKAENTKVFSFEFIPSNIELFKQNLALNSAQQIEIVERPVWIKSDEVFHAIDKGPASTLSNESSKDSIEIRTISIDDFSENKSLEKVNFIKMDIEGAELNALKGAEKTLKKFRPTLAIAVYHSPNDFSEIPAYIDSLKLNYKFYLGHYTPFSAETVLFATVENN